MKVVEEPITVLSFAPDGVPVRWFWRGRTHRTFRVVHHGPDVWRVHSTGGDVQVEITADGFAITGVWAVSACEGEAEDA